MEEAAELMDNDHYPHSAEALVHKLARCLILD